MRWVRLLVVTGALLAIYFLGQFLADTVVRQFDLVMHVRNEPTFHRLIMLGSAVYIALMSIPFMPAAEVGFSMILFFGPEICFLVYVCTVLALIPPYFVGRFIPVRYCAGLFEFVGLTRARALIDQIAPLSEDQRLGYLLDNAPARFAPFLLRHRYLALAVILNIPGNMVIGGGGGIAMLAGMTGIFSAPAYLLTVAIAVSPIPLTITLANIVF